MGADRIGSVGGTNTEGDSQEVHPTAALPSRSGSKIRYDPAGNAGSAGEIHVIRWDFCTAIFSRDLYLLWRRRTQQNHTRFNQ